MSRIETLADGVTLYLEEVQEIRMFDLSSTEGGRALQYDLLINSACRKVKAAVMPRGATDDSVTIKLTKEECLAIVVLIEHEFGPRTA